MIINNRRNVLLYSLVAITLISSCTKLDSTTRSELTEDIFPRTDQDFIYLSGPVYTAMRQYPEAFWNLQEAGTDEMIAPTRGSDWGDGGKWKNMHYHTFNPSIDLFNNAWNWGYGAIAQANSLVATIGASEASPERDRSLAELKTMRAFYYFCMMDMFGNIPIILETTTESNPPTKTRVEVWNFIVNDLGEAMPLLKDAVDQSTYGRPTKYVAEMILAKLYLNASVYIGEPKFSEAGAVLADIIQSGQFSLESNPLDMFRPDNGLDDGKNIKEVIFAIPFDATLATGANHFSTRTLHGANRATFNLPWDPWNGFTTLAEFYDSYNTSDLRINQWLIGPQKSSAGEQLYDGAYPVNFTKTFPNPTDFNQGGDGPGRSSGVRNIKYYPDSKAAGDRTANNDYLVFRFADVVLMKAESELRLGSVTTETLDLVNTIRNRAGVPPYTSLDLDELYKERGRELSWEGWRRNDMIRFGRWEDAFGFNSGTPGDTHKRIFPIPSAQLAINTALVQNPGY